MPIPDNNNKINVLFFSLNLIFSFLIIKYKDITKSAKIER